MSSLLLRTHQAKPSIFPLSVSSDGRYLKTPNGLPCFIHGDAGWTILNQLSLANAIVYLDDRRARGFNAILCELIEHKFTTTPPQNNDGVAPFTTSEDIRTPSDTFFNRAVKVAMLAAERNMLLFITPAYWGYAAGDEGWWTTAFATRTTAECLAYGQYVGAKFAALNNIVWVMGGDYWNAAVLTRMQQIQAGIAQYNANWLFTHHGNPEENASDDVNSEAWLTINSVYSYTAWLSKHNSAYANSPTRPVIGIESEYEAGNQSPTRAELRAQAYWSLCAGSCGVFFGNNPIWYFEAANGYPAYTGTWQSNMAGAGSADRVVFQQFQRQLNRVLVPDTSNLLMTAGHGTGDATANCAKSADGMVAAAYTPTQKSLTFDLSKMAGPNVRSRWYNIVTGEWTLNGIYSASGSQSWSPPTSSDWALMLESQ